MNDIVSAKILEYKGKTLNFTPEDPAEAKIPADECTSICKNLRPLEPSA